MKLGYLSNSQVSTTGAVGSVKGLLLQGSTAFTSSGVSVTAAATYTSLSQTATSGSGVGAVFTVQKTGSAPNYCSTVTFASGTIGSIKGALVQASTTFTASGTSVTAASTYTGVSQTATSGTGTGAMPVVAQLAKETGATAIVNAGNTTATKLVGQTQVYAKTGVAITYAFDYTSGTPATMAYELHLKLEAL